MQTGQRADRGTSGSIVRRHVPPRRVRRPGGSRRCRADRRDEHRSGRSVRATRPHALRPQRDPLCVSAVVVCRDTSFERRTRRRVRVHRQYPSGSTHGAGSGRVSLGDRASASEGWRPRIPRRSERGRTAKSRSRVRSTSTDVPASLTSDRCSLRIPTRKRRKGSLDPVPDEGSRVHLGDPNRPTGAARGGQRPTADARRDADRTALTASSSDDDPRPPPSAPRSPPRTGAHPDAKVCDVVSG